MKYVRMGIVCIVSVFLLIVTVPHLMASNEYCVHDYEINVKQPTCLEDGDVWLSCKKCGHMEGCSFTYNDLTLDGHPYVKEIVQDGSSYVIQYRCLECGDTYTEPVDMKAEHVYSFQCLKDSQGNYYQGGMDCTEETYAVYTCLNHSDETIEERLGYGLHQFAISPATEPTCTEDGHSETVYCPTCGEVFNKGTVYPNLGGHDYQFVNSADNYDYYKCINCNDFYKKVSESLNGWKQLDNEWYFYKDGNPVLSDWVKYNNKWYYLDNKGIMVKGYQEIDGIPYFFNEKGMLISGWQKIDGTWYYFTNTGAIEGWKKLNSKWYYFDDYEMVTNYQNIDHVQYKFNENGSLYSGWDKQDGDWYYFTSTGLATDWKKVNNKWYYFEKDGTMVSNTSMKIDGKVYKFDKNGAMIKG